MPRKQYGIAFNKEKIDALDSAIKGKTDRMAYIEKAMDEQMERDGIRVPVPPMPRVTAQGLGMSTEQMHIKQRKLYLTCEWYREAINGMPGFEHLWGCK